MKKSRKRKNPESRKLLNQALKGAIFLLIAGGFSLFAIQRITTASNTIATNKTTIASIESRNETVASFQGKLKHVSNEDKIIEEAFLEAQEIPEFITDLDELMKKYSIKHSIKFTDPVANQVATSMFTTSRIDFALTFEADIPTLTSVLEEFEFLPYFAAIQSMSIQASNPEGVKQPSTLNLSGRLYIKNDGLNSPTSQQP